MHKIFISYSQHEKDATLFQSLVSQLLAIAAKVSLSYADLAPPGSNKEDFALQCLEESDTILLLVSDEYIAQSDCKKEAETALEMGSQKNVVPILLRKCYIKEQPYAPLKWLPNISGGKEPVALDLHDNIDAACCSIVEEINALIQNPELASKNTAKESETWPAFFDKNPLKLDGGIWMTVNCDRKDHFSDGLQKSFAQNRKAAKSLVYFLSACEYQKPASLAKRLVYEFAAKGLNIGFTRVTERSTELTEIEVKIGLEPIDTWSELWKEILLKLFVQADTPADLATKTRFKGHDKIAVLLRLNEQRWQEPEVEEHIKFIVSQFDHLPNNARKFLVFFVFDFLRVNADRKELCSCHLDCLDNIMDSCKSDAIQIEHYKLMPPVIPDDVVVWFQDRIQQKTPESARNLLTNLKNQLEPQDQKRPDFDMIKVEEMQLEAWKAINKDASAFFDKKS